MAETSPVERMSEIIDLYDNLKEYMTRRFKQTGTFDHDILTPQVKRIIQVIEAQKTHALCELELKIALEVQKRREFSEVDASGWV